MNAILGMVMDDRGPKANVKYQRDPIGWMVDVMGIPEHTLRWSMLPEYKDHKWDGTPDPLVAVAEGIAAGRDVGVESATGTGKTRFGALMVQWFEAVFEDSISVTLAPKADQLRKHIWKEIGRDWAKFSQANPSAALLDLNLRMRGDSSDKESWSALGFPVGVEAGAESATKAQGFHANHMMFVFEETPGIPKPVMTAVENTCTGNHNLRLAFGNPDHQQDSLHQFCLSPGVLHVRISAYDHPNIVTGRDIVPGAVTRDKVLTRRVKYGRESRLYKSRVRGISPSEAPDALIKLIWCTEAKVRAVSFLNDGQRKRALGVDVANSENGDLAAIARGRGRICEEVHAFQCPNANKLGRDVLAEARLLDIAPENVGIDGVGVGSGTVNTVRDLGFWAQALNGGDGAVDGIEVEIFNNFRSQMYWQARLDLEHGQVALPDDDELIADLTTPTWKTHNGKIIVESKEDIKKRLVGGRSPNKGDAFVYWNWVRSRDVPIAQPQRPDEGDIESLAHAEQRSDDYEPWSRSDDNDFHQMTND